MKKLVQVIADRVRAHVQAHVANLRGVEAEFREVFNGPPDEILEAVFELLISEGGIEATRGTGEPVIVPVVLQLNQLPEGHDIPAIGHSGRCDEPYMMALRNAPNCPIFLGLVPPGTQAILSQTSTRSEFGVASQNNSKSATTFDWWHDRFIQELVSDALGRHQWTSDEREDARKLVEYAVHSADEIDKHKNSTRRAAWFVLSRLWSIADKQMPFGSQVSLACGLPPSEDGEVNADLQIKVLKELSARFEDAGIRPTIEELKQRASDEDERVALDQVAEHLQRRAAVLTALARSMPYYYGPFNEDAIDSAPQWWSYLTAQRWSRLLEENVRRRESLEVECTNSIISQTQGFIPVVRAAANLRISLPEGYQGPVDLLVTRDVGGASGHREWSISVSRSFEIIDDDFPEHKSPIRYSVVPKNGEATAELRKSTLRLISLNTWEPGVLVCARSASKGTVPKAPKGSREQASFETSLELNGRGRHYLDVYVREGVSIAEAANSSDEHGLVSESQSPIAKVSDSEFGFEVDVSSDCFYQFEFVRPEVGDDEPASEVFRIYLSGDDQDPEQCGSEFERLIRLNRQRVDGRATTDVNVDRQLRCTDLQSWMLSEARVASSYYPLVFAADYANDWRARDWTSEKDTIISRGRYLSDPRPSVEEMSAPQNFIEFRQRIAARIRGTDQDGLIESARLGEWLVSDPQFAEELDAYVRAYLDWLEADWEVAAWCDVSILARFEADGSTLVQEPDAILVSPLHPVRLAWHSLAQKALFLAQRQLPCPAASILDPDCVPDVIVLPLRTAAGTTKGRTYFSIECSSDYWSILWNASCLDRLAAASGQPPFDQEFGVTIGGVSSGFSVSQVHRALNDVGEMLVAKPMLNVLISSAAGQNNACNEGLIEWCTQRFASEDRFGSTRSLGRQQIQIFDERKQVARPEDAEVSNLAEDTSNAVRWFHSVPQGVGIDLGIIAQLETSNAGSEETRLRSPLGLGGLIRGRIRQQLQVAEGAFLNESRASAPRGPSVDALADKTGMAIARLENLGESIHGYIFAPSVHVIQNVLQKAQFAAVSSAAVDPACFLGGWLNDTYLWDYDLPSYSGRAGDSNGYYLLSRVKELDRETLDLVLSKLPGCEDLEAEFVDSVIHEVARRGIPTVRGLAGGDAGASGDLGLFVASRLLQDDFRAGGETTGSMFRVWVEDAEIAQIVLVLPVDPFRDYLDDLARAIKKPSMRRPDLIVASFSISDSEICCKLTPIEVKYRGGREPMSEAACLDALQQARSFSELLKGLAATAVDPEMVMWKLAFQHLLASMVGFGFRVYSQQAVVKGNASKWSEHHGRVVAAILGEELKLEIDTSGRLIVLDSSLHSAARDSDGDGLSETIVLTHADAAKIVKGEAMSVYGPIVRRVGGWDMLPTGKSFKLPSLERTESIDPDVSLKEEQDANADMRPTPTAKPSAASDGAAPEATPPRSTPPSAVKEKGPIEDPEAGIVLSIGRPLDGFEEKSRTLNISDTNLNQLNIGVVGDLGTGKTQFTKSLIYQISSSMEVNRGVRPRFLIFDYKKDYSSDDFVKAVGARVIKPHKLPINLFDLAGAGDSVAPWLDRFKFFSDVLDKIYSGVGPVQRSLLRKAVRQAYDEGEANSRQPTIYDVHEKYQSLLGNKAADSISSILEELVDMQMFATDVPQGGVEKFLDGVVVIALDALGQDDRTKNMLVAIMLNLFYEQMLRIPKRPFVGSEPQLRVVDSFLLVDEADNIMKYEFDVLRKILLQSREFGVGVLLASQYLRHFKVGATDYREPLLSWFIHKVPNVTAQELSALGLTGELAILASKVKSLGKHECLYKTFDVNGEFLRGTPFFELVKG